VLWLEQSDALPQAGFQLVRARIEWTDAGPSEGWGRDEDPAVAQLKAIAEAVERSAYGRLPPGAFEAAARELAGFLDPATLVRYASAQYAAPGFPLHRFDPGERRWWLTARCLGNGAELAVLADCVCSPRAFDAAYRSRLVTYTSSSGCASGRSIEDALLRAVLELVERDAFMRHWLAQSAGTSVRPASLPGWAAARLDTLTAAGCRAGTQCLTRGVHPTWLAWAQHEGMHFTCVGAASALAAEPALRSALDELETQALARLSGVPADDIAPADVRRPADHGALYATPAWFRRADRILAAPESCAFGALAASFEVAPEALYAKLAAAGHAPCWVDLSIPAAATVLDGGPLYTVRALAPGLIPITFGHGLLPLGMVHTVADGGRLLHPFS
jgi:ribosomal protein S12 methylthiotransferase accessory factor